MTKLQKKIEELEAELQLATATLADMELTFTQQQGIVISLKSSLEILKQK